MRITTTTLSTTCVLLLAAAVAAQPGPEAFDGTFRVLVPQLPVEATLWIVKVDKGKPSLVAGVGPFDKSKLSDVKAGPGSLSFRLATDKQAFDLRLAAPGKDGVVRGSARSGQALLPVWLEKAEIVTLDEKTAFREMPGVADLRAALQEKESADRVKALTALLDKGDATMTAYFALQNLIVERFVREKAEPAVLAALVERYRKVCAAHGPAMLLGANVDLTRNLLAHPKGGDLAVKTATAAVKAVEADAGTDVKLTVHLALAAALHKAEKSAEIDAVVKDLDAIAQAALKAAGTKDEADAGAALSLGTAIGNSPAPKVADLGLGLLRESAKRLTDKSAPERKGAVYRTLSRALRAHKKDDEAKKLEPTLDKIENELDAAFRKASVPFEPKPFMAWKTSKRVVLVEEFTNAQAPPVVAADTAVRAAASVSKSDEAVYVRYHVQLPRAFDALGTIGGQTRLKAYEADLNGQVPSILVDGAATKPPGGAAPGRAKEVYDDLKEMMTKARESAPDTTLSVTATLKDNRITAEAVVGHVTAATADVRLRVVLVEDEIRYQGGSGQRLHASVARGFLGGADGVKVGRGKDTFRVALNLADLRESHTSYLDGIEKANNMKFLDRPLALKRLRVVAFLQEEDSKKVHQAATAEVK